jgi:hypothetical protein
MPTAFDWPHWRDRLRYAGAHPAVRAGALALALATLALLAVGAFRWWPAYGAYCERAVAAQALTAEVRGRLHAARLGEAVRAAEREIAAWEPRLRPAGTQSALIDRTTRLAARQRLAIVAQALREETRPDGVAALQQELTVEGPYAGAKAFLGAMRGLPGWTVVRAVQMERAGQPEGGVRMQVRLVTYRAPAAGGGQAERP